MGPNREVAAKEEARQTSRVPGLKVGDFGIKKLSERKAESKQGKGKRKSGGEE